MIYNVVFFNQNWPSLYYFIIIQQFNEKRQLVSRLPFKRKILSLLEMQINFAFKILKKMQGIFKAS